ncbi:MAG TPA: NADH-quinone oxidoreductase subunit N [Candidatus Binatia bacterium]|nr:NADH-quinone oxidoreductase subunit N [Candidatus Binatia bacterium]
MDATAHLGNLPSIPYLLPEIVLGTAVVAFFLLDLMIRDKERLGDIALVVMAIVVVLTTRLLWVDEKTLFHGSVVLDGFALYFKLLLALAAFGAIWMSIGSREVRRTNQGEYYGVLLASSLGMLFMASANNLLMAYLSLEFVSLTSYVLSGYMRHSRRAGEASLKYLIYGGVASGAMIFGMSWIYGLAGSLEFRAIHEALANGGAAPLPLFIGLLLTLTGLGYKVAAFPFHMWAPDIYEGAPIPVSGFLAVGSKAAGFALLIRFFYTSLAHATGAGVYELVGGVDWKDLVIALSILTMTFGNLAALNQQANLKRLLAYSSIAHAGYTLMGFVVLTDDGLRAMLFYLAVYYVMNLGAFVVVMLVANSTGREDLAGFRGLAWRGGAWPAVAMAIFMFSLTGLPPFGGFVGKVYLFAAVVQEKLYFLALAGVINSVLSLFYYAKVVRTMFLDQPVGGEGAVAVDAHNGVLLGALAVGTIVLGIAWWPLADFAGRSARFFLG